MKPLLDVSGVGRPDVPLHLRYSKLAIITTEEYASGAVKLERSENGDIVALSAFKRDLPTLAEAARIATEYGLEIKWIDPHQATESTEVISAKIKPVAVAPAFDTLVGPSAADHYVGEDACGLCKGQKATTFSRDGISRWRGCRRCKATGRQDQNAA